MRNRGTVKTATRETLQPCNENPMSDARKAWLDRWLPTLPILLGLIAQTFWFGYRDGVTQTNIAALQKELMPFEKRIEVFMPRVEVNAANKSRDAEILAMREEFRSRLVALESKLDRLIERSPLSKND